jgi:hypothetical protein
MLKLDDSLTKEGPGELDMQSIWVVQQMADPGSVNLKAHIRHYFHMFSRFHIPGCLACCSTLSTHTQLLDLRTNHRN